MAAGWGSLNVALRVVDCVGWAYVKEDGSGLLAVARPTLRAHSLLGCLQVVDGRHSLVALLTRLPTANTSPSTRQMPLPCLLQALPAEKANMVHVPCWQDEDPQDGMVPHFVEVLLHTFGTLAPDADVREHTAAASKKLHAVAARLEEERRQQQQLGQGREGEQQGAAAANGQAAPNEVLGDGAAAASNPEEIDIDIDC